MSKKMVTPRYGKPFEVDISNEACGKFGCKHGDKIIDCQGYTGVVEGVAPATGGAYPRPEVLWVARDLDEGKVGYCHPLGPRCLRPVPKNALGGE